MLGENHQPISLFVPSPQTVRYTRPSATATIVASKPLRIRSDLGDLHFLIPAPLKRTSLQHSDLVGV